MTLPTSTSVRLTGLFAHIMCVVIVLYACTFATAQHRAQPSVSTQIDQGPDPSTHTEGGTVEGVVTDIQGDSIQIAGGLIIDASRARIFVADEMADLSSLKPGMRIRTVVSIPPETSSPIQAEFIEVQLENELAIKGVVQDVDQTGGSIQVLNQRILIPSGRLLIVCEKGSGPCVLKKRRMVTVSARFSGTELIATQIILEAKRR